MEQESFDKNTIFVLHKGKMVCAGKAHRSSSMLDYPSVLLDVAKAIECSNCLAKQHGRCVCLYFCRADSQIV